MTPEEQRIAIAEACGWKIAEWGVSTPSGAVLFRGTRESVEYLPNYLNDLNAMHEAEKVLLKKGVDERDWGSCEAYRRELVCLIREDCVFYATAPQRAQAFLKTLNLWRP